MLKQRNEQIQLIVRTADVVVCLAAFFLAYSIRNRTTWFGQPAVGSLTGISWILVASLVLHFLIYPAFGFYESLRLKRVKDIILMVFKASLVEFFVLGALVFLFQEKELSRYFFGLFVALNATFVLAEKLGARILLSSIRKRGYNTRSVLIYGTGSNARQVMASLRRNRHWGFVPSGVLLPPREPKVDSVDGLPVVGALADLQRVAGERVVDEVYFATDYLDQTEITEAILLCEKLGIPARISLGFLDMARSKVTYSQLDRTSVLTFYTTLMTPAEAFLKRTMDIAIALIGLILTGFLYPWIALMIRRENSGPVIFKQIRVGENGRKFKCYKFRTMVVDAENMKRTLEDANEMSGPIFKLEHDPRVTKFGAFLRRTSLDELPQFLNILRGDMSVVGTRPPTPDEVNRYETHFRRRLSIRPGLTGLWQVSGRNQVRDFEQILRMDLEYIDQWSIWLDFKIILKTVWITTFGRGAF